MRQPEEIPVCVISSCYDPADLGGVGVLVEAERKALSRMGFPVHMIGAGDSTPGEVETTRVRAPKKLYPWAVVPAYLRARRRQPFRIVHVHEFSGAWVSLVVRLERALIGRGPRVVTTLQCSFLRESRMMRAHPGERLTPREWFGKWVDFPYRYLEGLMGARLSDCVVGVSRASCRKIGVDYLGSAGRPRLVPNGVDPDLFHPGRDGGPLRRECGLEDSLVILYSGRFVGRKGVEYLLQAFARVARRHGLARLLLVGSGRRDYSRLIRRLGIRDLVRILPGRPHLSMPEVHAAADIFCLPTLMEGLPLAVLEAMASGKPVVASRTDGIPEVVRHGETGVLVDPARVAPLARALDLLLSNPRLRERLGRAARAAVARGFSWERVMDHYGGMFRRLDHEGPGRSD